IGILLVAAGIVLFKIPNEFATGGVTGISILLSKVLPWISVGTLMLIINIVFLALGLIFAGIEFEIKTIYSTLMLSGVVWLVQKIHPISKPLTGDTMLELIFAILLLAAGSAILFFRNASSGGTDIIAKIINHRVQWHIGKTLLIVDLSISIFAIFIFNLKIGMYSILGVIIKGLLIDSVIEGLHSSKQMVIISDKPEEIKEYIMNTVKRGVTIYHATGGKSNSEKLILNTVVSNRQAVRIRRHVARIDENAFVIVDSVSEIYGRGFETFV
ncbi:MAG TPA: YitT family protein, partial [Clostridia bacterium]